MTQKQKILKLLKDNPKGINSYGVARDLALQLPTRVWELKQMGYNITSVTKDDKSVDYVLLEGEITPIEKPRAEFVVENGIYIAKI